MGMQFPDFCGTDERTPGRLAAAPPEMASHHMAIAPPPNGRSDPDSDHHRLTPLEKFKHPSLNVPPSKGLMVGRDEAGEDILRFMLGVHAQIQDV